MPAKHDRSPSQEDVLKHPSTKRAKEIDGPDNPYQALTTRVAEADADASGVQARGAVLHWFRSKDLRIEDNRALHAASSKAREARSPLLACFLFSPADLEWHGTSPARVDFMLESLRRVQEQLADLDIPLVPLTAEDRGSKAARLLDFVRAHDVSHVYANMEYEVDELRRDLDLLDRLAQEKEARRLVLLHDQTVVVPGALTTRAGGPLKVFTPYHKAWLAEVAAQPELLDTRPPPQANDKKARSRLADDLFGRPLPAPPASKRFTSDAERDRLRALWPAGHAAGADRLRRFLDDKVATYAERRSAPADDNASRLSPYFAAGVLSVREALVAARPHNDDSVDFAGSSGVAAWVRELVFREFYRHLMTVTPHDGMNLPHNLKFAFVEWEDDDEGWRKWCEGRTGVPFVDAGMRQLNHEAYLHVSRKTLTNLSPIPYPLSTLLSACLWCAAVWPPRLECAPLAGGVGKIEADRRVCARVCNLQNRARMNVASYLRTNLLLDYRRGERYFAEHLVDWDLCNNTQGWEPSYTVFNPVTQAERHDPRGDYIRRWVPELRAVEGKAVFDPYHRLDRAAFKELGYPEPHVDFQETKARCVQRYKQDMADADP